MTESFNKGIYIPKNPEKYIGKNKIIFRSGWEYDFMKYLDIQANIKAWGSECVVIPYSFCGKNHRYFTDFLVVTNEDKKIVIEIKPLRQTKLPRKSKNKSDRTLLYEQFTYMRNQAKWQAAIEYCKKRGWEFKILTEKELLI